MTDSVEIIEALESRQRRREDRRAFFQLALGAAAVGAGFVLADASLAQTIGDADVLNFALNLEYLEANFYSFAVFGRPIDDAITGGTGTRGAATGGRAVTFNDPTVAQFAREIANDEIAHVNYLRSQLTAAAVAQPAIDLGVGATNAFSNAARAAGIITGANDTFDPYGSTDNFLLGAFLFEDVGVTAYKGASPLISNKTYLEAAAGILAVEAYHAAMVRTALYERGLENSGSNNVAFAGRISDARDSLDGTTDIDQGIAEVTLGSNPASNIVPVDANGLTFSRSAANVLNVVYLNKAAVSLGGFFPAGVNGTIKSSNANG